MKLWVKAGTKRKKRGEREKGTKGVKKQRQSMFHYGNSPLNNNTWHLHAKSETVYTRTINLSLAFGKHTHDAGNDMHLREDSRI